MSITDQIKERAEDYLTGNYVASEGYSIPTREDLTFGKTAKKINCKVLYADLRGSKSMLSDHGPIPAIRMHKCFLYAVTKCVHNQGGFIRSFNGDSALCFFKNNDFESSKAAVKAAMNIKYAIEELVNPKMKEKYGRGLDFGIGIAQGEIHVAKSGFQGDPTYQDLIWVGYPTYIAHKFGDSAKSPKNIWISDNVYNSIKKDATMTHSNGVNMWELDYDPNLLGGKLFYKTHYRWPL